MATRDTHYLAEPGDILVADFGGNLDVSNMGGQSVAVAQSCGLVGAVVNGAVRDVPSFRAGSFPHGACGTTPITGKCRMQAVEINGPVTLYDMLVEPGDLIVGRRFGSLRDPRRQGEFRSGKMQVDHQRRRSHARIDRQGRADLGTEAALQKALFLEPS